MAAEIQALIDKQDSFELVRDQIAAILAIEEAQQRVYAAAAAEDPELWRLNVFIERSNPWEQFLDCPAEEGTWPAARYAPLVCVWFDSSSFPRSAGNTISWQQVDGTFNVDIYGVGYSETNGSGHLAGDKAAALNAHRGARLARNILMAGQYTNLALPTIVGARWVESLQSFQPQFEQRPTQHVVAMRLALSVRFTEYAPEYQGVAIETLIAQVEREDSGYVYFNAEYQAS